MSDEEEEDYEEDKIDELPFRPLEENIKILPKRSGKNLMNITPSYVYTRKFTTISKKNMNFRQSKSIKENVNIFKNQIPNTNTKITKITKLTKITNTNKNQIKNKKNTRSIIHLSSDYEELFCAEIYKEDEDELLKPKLIQNFLKVKECSILRYGLKPSIDEIEFSFCRTCDSNLMNPICTACLKKCHIGHKIKRTMLKGNIKCVCGEKLHCFTKSLNIDINNENCLLAEWFIISKMNFYYKTNSENEEKKLCMLCYNFCNENNDTKGEIVINKDENVFINCECCCINDYVHLDRKNLFNKLYEIAECKDRFEYFKLLHPTQIINMIFKSKKQFEYNYSDFIELIRILNVENYENTDDYNSFVKVDFASTNCYLIFRHLESFIKGNKGTDISYYCEETKKFFCVDILKKILFLLNPMKHKEKSYWLLTQKYLNLFHKIYIGNLLQTFDKYKLSDLENFSFYQRFLIFFENEKNCKESQDIVSFLILMLKNININGFNEIEAEGTITVIIKILQKFSCFYLISNGDMIRIIQEIEKILRNMKLLRKLILKKNKDLIDINRKINEKTITNRITIIDKKSLDLLYSKEIKLYHTVIKLIHYFHFIFNDRLIHNILNNKEKYPTINSIIPENTLFTFGKIDFGKILLKLTIRILYSVQKNFQEKSKDLYFKNIMKHGVKIISYAIRIKENYLLSIMKCLDRLQYYEKINIININIKFDKEYIDICNEKTKLENNYLKYFNFEINLNELLKIVNKSVDFVLGDALTEFHSKTEQKVRGLGEKKTTCIIKTQYFYILSKFYQILHFELKKIENLPIEVANINKINEELLNTIIEKIFLFYENFIYNSSDNSLLIMSCYIFRDLCKVPTKYGLKNFELFYNCIYNLSIHDGIASNTIVYFNNLFRYLDYLNSISYEKINDCLIYFLKIMDLFIFNIKCLDAEITIAYTKKIMIRINTIFDISRTYFNNKVQKNGEIREDELNKLEKALFIYLRIVNDVFEFMYIEDREIIQKIINPSSIEFCLKYYDIDLNLRTELLRFVRKFYIDLIYNNESRQIYANSVITNEDNLYPLKTNPLITNYQYPTKYFSFYKDFLNLSIRHLLENTNPNIVSALKETYQYQSKIIDSIQTDLMKYNSTSNSPTDKIIKEKENEKEKEKEKENDSSDYDSSDDEEEEEKEKKHEEKKENVYNDDSDDDDEIEESLTENSNIKKQRKLIPCFDEKIYDILMNELDNIKLITSSVKTYSDVEMECLKNYFENGLLIPIIYFLKKSFSLSHCFTGKEMVFLSKLVFGCLKLRLFIAGFKYNFWKEFLDYGENSYNNKISNCNTFNLSKEVEEFTKIYNKRGNCINGNFCIDNKLNQQCKADIKLLSSKKQLCYDFTNLYDITRKNIFSLLKDRRENIFNENFIEESMNLSLKAINKEENELFPDYEKKTDFEKRIIRIYLLYKHGKKQVSNENNSSLFSILPEISLEFETNYRNLLIIFLVNCGKEISIYKEIINETYFILCKLLSVQTKETQNDLINLLGGIRSEDLGFLVEFSENLFMKIIVLFIEVFNPPDKLLDINYVYSFTLIKIFKNLCEEHNNFFQGRLIKSLNYKYREFIPMFFKENAKDSQSNDDGDITYSEKNFISKSVIFFDFFLHVASKIILVSEWDRLEFLPEEELFHKQNRYLYDPFAAILEMLNEIIQGNKPEFLIKIANPMSESDNDDFYEDDKLISEEGKNSKKKNISFFKQKEKKNDVEKNDAFQCFVKNVSDFIFRDNLSLELLYEIRNDLMQFFTSIIEEKNCNEEMQKFIIKNLNINRVFKSISIVLKSYYLNSNDSEIIEYNKNKDENFDTDKNYQYNSNYNSSPIKKENNYNDMSKYQSSIIDYSKSKKFQNEFNTKFLVTYKRDIFRTIREKRNKVIFNEKLLEYYRKTYYSNSEFNQTNEFILSNAFYKYIKLITVLNKSEEAKQLLEQTESMSEETAKRKFQTVNQQKNKQNLNSVKKINKKQKTFTINKNATKKSIKKNLTFFEIEKKNKTVSEKIPESFDELKSKTLNNTVYENIKNLNKNEEKQNYSSKILTNLNENKNFSSLLNEQNQQYDKDFIERYYIIKFFEGITSTVEVRTENSINQIVIFTQLPEMIYLSGGTKAEFEQKANRESETSKKNYLVRHVEYFQKEIKYYQHNENSLSHFISKIDFYHVQVLSYLYALFLNLLILFTLHGDTQITINSVESGSIKERRTNKTLIYELTHKSIRTRNSAVDILCNCYSFLNAILIFLWVYFRMPLYYKIDRLKFMEENNISNKKNLTFLQKLYIIFVLTIWDRDYISTLIYEFLLSLISSTFEQGEILYVALLLSIIDLNPTLKNIYVSIKLRYKELCLTFCLATIFMYVFSNLAFFFYNKDYEQELDYYDDNVCKSLVFCFLNTIDSGLRARGGIGDSAIRVSYQRDNKHYIGRVFLDDFFFLLVVIISIDLVFGIIIGAFTTLRNEEQKHNNDRRNHCFICHANKNILEKNRQNFIEHRAKTHYIWNYVDYMIALKFSDVHDLNAINSYVKEKIENKNISWLPTYKDLSNRENRRLENDQVEDELKIEEEGINKYVVKK